jgi:hypothetical protein
MGEGSREIFSFLFQLIFYISMIIQIGIAVAALLRFKATPSGLLIGGGFGASVLIALLFKGVDAALKAAGPGGDALMFTFAARSVLQLLMMLLVGVGVVLIPMSFEKLMKRA